jgi:hypothetical protein
MNAEARRRGGRGEEEDKSDCGTRADFRPDGAKVCSHGWSEAKPVETGRECLAPERAKEVLQRENTIVAASIPPPLRGGCVRASLSTGCACPPIAGGASPVATDRRPAGAELTFAQSEGAHRRRDATTFPPPPACGEPRRAVFRGRVGVGVTASCARTRCGLATFARAPSSILPRCTGGGGKCGRLEKLASSVAGPCPIGVESGCLSSTFGSTLLAAGSPRSSVLTTPLAIA